MFCAAVSLLIAANQQITFGETFDYSQFLNLQEAVYPIHNVFAYNYSTGFPIKNEVFKGSGFAVVISQNHYILTNYHLYRAGIGEDGNKIMFDSQKPKLGTLTIEISTLLISKGKRRKTEGVAMNPELDYALLRLKGVKIKTAVIFGSSDLKPQSVVYVINPKNSQNLIYKKCVVKKIKNNLIYMIGDIIKGDSGKPIAAIENDSLKVVGIISRKNPGEYGGQAVAIDSIIKDIKTKIN
jgi:hypothetical protein